MKVFLNGQDLIDYCAEKYQASTGDVLWFVCMQEAEMVSQTMTLKDIAELFRCGIPAYKNDPQKVIDDYVHSNVEDLLYHIEEGNIVVENGEISEEAVEMAAVPDLAEAADRHFAEFEADNDDNC